MRGATLGAFTVALTLAGCQGKVPDRATVSGRVLYQGKPVTQGIVIFHSKLVPTKQDQAQIKKDGTYEMTNAPLGVCKVVIQVNPAKDPAADKAGDKAGDKAPDAPPSDKAAGPPPQDVVPAELGARYASIDTTPLEKTVERGDNKFDLEIK
jgi:hypothetical protein